MPESLLALLLLILNLFLFGAVVYVIVLIFNWLAGVLSLPAKIAQIGVVIIVIVAIIILIQNWPPSFV